MNLAAQLDEVATRITAACVAARREPAAVELVAVSKRHPAELVRAAYAAGQRHFGENRVQELVVKAADLDDLDGLRWHMIGSLQTNKVRELLSVPHLELLHSLDRARLADELQRELERADRSLAVLLQVNATGEAQKHGCVPGDAAELVEHVVQRCPRLRLVGLMGMGPIAGDPAPTFARIAELRRQLADRSGLPLPILSLGMTGDLEVAVAAGSTMVRIGTAVFGDRG